MSRSRVRPSFKSSYSEMYLYPKYIHEKVQHCLNSRESDDIMEIDKNQGGTVASTSEFAVKGTVDAQTETDAMPSTTTAETQTDAVGNTRIPISRSAPVKRSFEEVDTTDDDEEKESEPVQQMEKRVDSRQSYDDDEIPTSKTNPKSYFCEKCGNAFATEEGKYTHLRLAHPEKPPIGSGHVRKHRTKGKIEKRPSHFNLWLPSKNSLLDQKEKPKSKIKVQVPQTTSMMKDKLVKKRNKFVKWD